ncbi:hypothetical protein O0I10_011766 [Lichtheimia ornata]|uniref:Uncharacterized protein n=1 Tax=Lichtheimia ornata TaxID=688661 RepID=A0AAD7UUC0_9FUNG|nr:uncharacterized protein O0I10_011766 [Lichtheimia ornata]KAJ8652620.1 hypothetical protein O0I10_011766 [Lichtheimia ornata]
MLPGLRHLYYQQQYTPGPIQPITGYDEDQGDHKEEEEESRSNNGVSLRGLSIHASDAESFMYQRGIKYLRLVHAHLSHPMKSTFFPSRLIHQNCNTLEALDLSPTSLKWPEVLIPSFASLINLKRIRIWFRYMDTLCDQAVGVF